MAATEYAQTIKNDTKYFITTALLQLLKKDILSNLTVSQVTKRAGVSRMAFYRNFKNIEQVLYEYYEPKISEIFYRIRTSSKENIKFESLTIFFQNLSSDLLLAIKQGYEPGIYQIFTQQIKKFYEFILPDSDVLFIAFMSAGVYALWRKWLVEGQKMPLSDITHFLKKLSGQI
jgi:AcrR family transcriptional regulator